MRVMTRLKLIVFLFFCILLPTSATIEVTGLRVENMINPLGLNTAKPRFSWKIIATGKQPENDVMQTSYRIIVASSMEKIQRHEGDLWDSGDVYGREQLWIGYEGKPLCSGQQAFWNVLVKTNKGNADWSNNDNTFSIGLLGESHWRGRWIGMDHLQVGKKSDSMEHLQQGEQMNTKFSRLAARYLRKEYVLKTKAVKRATAYIAGLGLYRLYINGQSPQQGDEMTPLPSDYRKTIYYDTYDITAALQTAATVPDTSAAIVHDTSESGKKVAIAIILGNGRYFAPRQDKPYKNTLFGLPKCRLNITIEYEDGTTDSWATDESWRITANGPIRANNEYDGELYDARMDLGSWMLPGYDDSSWQQAERTSLPTGTPRGRVAPNMRVCTIQNDQIVNRSEDYIPTIRRIASTTYILDFGHNIAGRVSFMPYGNEGDTIRLRYAELLNADGTLYTANLRTARTEDVYICSGSEPKPSEKSNKKQSQEGWNAYHAWHATFVTHGFRYVEVTGMKNPRPEWFRAEEIRDDMATISTFECSDTILNKVWANARRGIAANYKGMPIDCPQRDERQPWLGDRTIGAIGESYIFDNERLYTKWMRDIAESQREDGCIPDVAPAFWNYYTDDVTWPAALPMICYMLYRQYGNDEAINMWMPNIKHWLQHILDRYTSKDGLITKDKYGDWCVPPESPKLIHSQDPDRKTDGRLIATAYTIGCLKLLKGYETNVANRAHETNKTEVYDSLIASLTKAFNKAFLTVKRGSSPRPNHLYYPDSTYYGNNTATANLLALAFDIVPDSLRQTIARQVVENIMVKNKCHVSTGVIGISWLMRMLSRNGYGDVAWELATQHSYPSWGYMVEKGATTIWELWNGDTANPAMNSANHVMLLGDLLTWCYEDLAGIRPITHKTYETHNTYKATYILSPDFSIEGCDWLRCSYETPYGKLESKWKKTRESLEWDITVPCNTIVEAQLPDGSVKILGSGHHTLKNTIPFHHNEQCDDPSRHKSIEANEFLYTKAPFASCHASTIVETRKGTLVAAYFGGTYERNPDCNIYVNRKVKGSNMWSAPILAADGDGVACWNPVLVEMPKGEIWLFYKVGTRVGTWTGWLTRSKDDGRTWSRPEQLPEGFLGPVKNKPIILRNAQGDDELICGSSTEDSGWRFHVEILNLKTNKWTYVGPVESTIAVKTDDNQPHPIDCIQPSLLQLEDGRLQVLMRTHNARLATSYSSDGGHTWTPVTLTEVENNQSGTDAVTLRKPVKVSFESYKTNRTNKLDTLLMRHALVYNNFATLPLTKKGPRTPLSLALSPDGEHWYHYLTLEDKPGDFSYPSIIEGRDGSLHIVYTWHRKRIGYKKINIRK